MCHRSLRRSVSLFQVMTTCVPSVNYELVSLLSSIHHSSFLSILRLDTRYVFSLSRVIQANGTPKIGWHKSIY